MAPTHELPELDEAYFVLAGEGEIWRRHEDREAITQLRPGRFVWMPAGCRFQYRANQSSSLVFLVVVLPSWRPELFHIVNAGPWTSRDGETRTPWEELSEDWFSGDMHQAPDSVAPDGSEIRLLGNVAKGSLSHCTLRQGTTSRPVRHRTVHELWYVTGGHGELWRAHPAGEERVDQLWPGVGVDIQTSCAFQFRVTGYEPLKLDLLTMPRWPGAEEALLVTDGHWS